ncbi:alpha/beta hydrolase [Aurantibacter sp.]|uniref:alpha/beta fold hydrolase n=1 Tax=Aurantibacter sp. TaxID=2807103 RepID=UPI00326732F0
MRQLAILILVFIATLTSYGQVTVNPNGKFFNYNGTKIYYEDTGSGEPLLLLHNFFNTADSWEPYIAPYSKQYRTIAVDMMGHGRSDIYKIDDFDFDHGVYAKMILALLDSLGLDQVKAIGASSGGTTLLYLNTMQPDRFKSVITVGGHIYYSTHAREMQAKLGMDQARKWAVNWGQNPEKQEYLAQAFWQDRNPSDADPYFTPDKLNTIKAKWLVVLGDNDFVIPLELGIEMYKGIPNSRLWIVPNGNHLPHLEPEIQPEFLRVSLEFLGDKWNTND